MGAAATTAAFQGAKVLGRADTGAKTWQSRPGCRIAPRGGGICTEVQGLETLGDNMHHVRIACMCGGLCASRACVGGPCVHIGGLRPCFMPMNTMTS